MRRLLTRVVLSLLGLVTAVFLLKQFAVSDLNPYVNSSEIQKLILEIRDTEKLPDRMQDLYVQLHDTVSTYAMLFDWLKGQHHRKCPCLLAADQLYYHTKKDCRLLNNRFVIALKLEKSASQSDCLSFLSNHSDFLYGNRSIYQAARFYFNKDLHELESDQQRVLMQMIDNPSLYNPRRNPNSASD